MCPAEKPTLESCGEALTGFTTADFWRSKSRLSSGDSSEIYDRTLRDLRFNNMQYAKVETIGSSDRVARQEEDES